MAHPQPTIERFQTAPAIVPPDSGWFEPAADRLLKAIGWMMFAYIWRVQDVLPILAKVQLPILVALASLAFFVASRQPVRSLKQTRSPIASLCVALFVIMLIGVPTSLWPGHSLSFALKGETLNIMFMLLVAASIRSLRDVEWFAKVNLYGAMFFATIVALFFRVGPDGRLSNLVFYDANDFALVMVTTIPFALFFLRPGVAPRRRMLATLALALILLGVVRSGSRGGFLALITVFVYVVIRYRAIPSRVRTLAAVTGVALVAIIGSDKYWTLISTIAHPQSDYNWTDPEGRKAVWERGLGYIEHHPLLGVGVKSYPIAEGKLSDIGRQLSARGKGFKWSVAHNSFLETAAELGIPGLLVFVSMLLVAMRTLNRMRPGRRYGPWVGARERALAQMLLGAMIGFSVAGVFVSAEYFSYLYFLLGMVIGLDKILRLRRDAAWAAVAKIGRPVRLASAPAPASPVPAFPLPSS